MGNPAIAEAAKAAKVAKAATATGEGIAMAFPNASIVTGSTRARAEGEKENYHLAPEIWCKAYKVIKTNDGQGQKLRNGKSRSLK